MNGRFSISRPLKRKGEKNQSHGSSLSGVMEKCGVERKRRPTSIREAVRTQEGKRLMTVMNMEKEPTRMTSPPWSPWIAVNTSDGHRSDRGLDAVAYRTGRPSQDEKKSEKGIARLILVIKPACKSNAARPTIDSYAGASVTAGPQTNNEKRPPPETTVFRLFTIDGGF